MGTQRHAAAPIGRKYPVQHERVNVHVQIQGRAEALDDGHRTAATIHHTSPMGLATQPAEHGPQLDRDHGPAERVVPRQQVTKTRRQGQHPLANGYVWKHVIDQVRGPIRHASPPTTRAEPAALAGERDQPIEMAIRASESREPSRQAPARQEVAKLLLDEARQTLAVPQVRRLCPERLEVVAHQLVQGALLGSTRLIGG